jgi:pimeloyl-ACP methyl ester carboxylesterase
VALAGSVSRPRDGGPWPAIVLLSGSGPQDRDEDLGAAASIKPFAVLGDALTRAGFLVLRYDDRGVAASTGDYASAVIADFTADARAALDYLLTRPDVDAERVGVLGHSEGGIYAATLAASDARLAFAVGMAPPAASGLELIVAQNGAVVRSIGGTAEDAARAEAYARDFFTAVLAGEEAEARSIATTYFRDFYDRQPASVQEGLGERDAFVEDQVDTQLRTAQSPWFLSFLRSDPGADWARSDVPVLGLFGGKDVQVLASQNAPLMEEQLARAAQPGSQVVTIADANHLFQAAVTGAVGEYATLPAAFTDGFLPALLGWLDDIVGSAPR